MQDSDVQVVVPEPYYTLFNATRNDLPDVVVVNRALLAFAHIDIFPWHLSVVLEARDLIDNGMPSTSESKILFEIGDEIEGLVLAGRTSHGAKNALFLARSTWNGLRELQFQIHDPEIAHGDLEALLNRQTWSRPWQYEMRSDPDWTSAGYIFQLFPKAEGSDA